MVESSSGRVFDEPDSCCGIALGITIHQQSRLFSGSEASRQVYRGSCFSNPALLICNGDDSRQQSPNLRKVSRVARRMQLVSRGTSVGLWNLSLKVPRGTVLHPPAGFTSRSAWSNYAPLAMQTCSTWNTDVGLSGPPQEPQVPASRDFTWNRPSPPLPCCDWLQRSHVELPCLAYLTN